MRLVIARLAITLSLVVTAGRARAGESCERVEYAMGTMLRVVVEAATEPAACAAVDSAFAVVHRYDSLLSNYKPESDLSRLARAAPEPLQVKPAVYAYLQETLTFARACGGALNPAIGALVELWGFYGQAPTRPDSVDLAERAPLCDLDRIELDSASESVRLRAGMQLDPGATGKGYALRVAAGTLANLAGTETVFFDFGGQVYWQGETESDQAVRHPRNDTALVSVVRFAHGSLATSGDYERYFELDGIRYAHILDPRTGQPVQGRAAVTVFARDPFLADALSTALFVLGPAEGTKLLDQYPACGALFAEWERDSLRFITAGCWDALESR